MLERLLVAFASARKIHPEVPVLRVQSLQGVLGTHAKPGKPPPAASDPPASDPKPPREPT